MKAWMILACTAALFACTSAEQKPEKRWDVKVSTEGDQKVWVAKPDGSKQCGQKGKKLLPEAAAEQLKGAGILVYQWKPGSDGMMRIQQCGAATGATVDVEIARKDLARAQALGYRQKPTQAE